MPHYPSELKDSADFANARMDALQASLATAFGKGDPILESGVLRALQDMDVQLAQKWDDISAVRAEREGQ